MSSPLRRQAAFHRWSPHSYYRDYYSTRVEPDEQAAIRFQIEFLKKTRRRFDRAIEYGCGPTLMRALAAAPYVKQLDMADWHPGNLERVRRWQRGDPQADDWSAFSRYALDVEGNAESVADREANTRSILGELLRTDAREENPLGPERRGSYDFLVSGFCVDCFTDRRDLWRSSLRNVISVLKPGGCFTIFALREAAAYRVGQEWFPAANVSRALLAEALSDAADLHVVECDLPSHANQGYEGILMASGYVAQSACPGSVRVFV